MLLIISLLTTLTTAIIAKVRLPWSLNTAPLGHMGEAWRARYGSMPRRQERRVFDHRSEER